MRWFHFGSKKFKLYHFTYFFCFVYIYIYIFFNFDFVFNIIHKPIYINDWITNILHLKLEKC